VQLKKFKIFFREAQVYLASEHQLLQMWLAYTRVGGINILPLFTGEKT